MQFGQMNMSNNVMRNNINNSANNMNGIVNPNRNLNNMNVRITSGPSNANKANIAGINSIPQFDRDSRFKNVKIDKSPAKQIMNSAGQNLIQNKIRGVGDISAR